MPDIRVLQADYGYGDGWEDEVTYTRPEMVEGCHRRDLRDYRENAPEYRYRLITRRVKAD